MWILNGATGTAVRLDTASKVWFKQQERQTSSGPRDFWLIMVGDEEVFVTSDRQACMEKLKWLHRKIGARTIHELMGQDDEHN